MLCCLRVLDVSHTLRLLAFLHQLTAIATLLQQILGNTLAIKLGDRSKTPSPANMLLGKHTVPGLLPARKVCQKRIRWWR